VIASASVWLAVRSCKPTEACDPKDELVCVTVYKRGATEVVRRLAA
jgi:hypothetical protein